ncbi:MAG: sulfatase-like hydrolase/transferase [Bryobacterales bacterium]|nr:sulfatase-like hydrolase/transferase [Bryobacterales bacterium]
MAALALPGRGAQTERKLPNVVFVMTDDHGAWANGIYGCTEIQTPNIDALAREGMLFTRAFASTPVCSPSRVTFFTGKLPYAHGVQDWIIPKESFGPESRPVLAEHESFPEVLARNGYHLGLSGKWHMGGDEQAQEGFSYWRTVPGGGGPYKDAEFVLNGETRRMPGFKTDHVGDGAVEFLKLHQRTRPNDPFFLNLSFYAPHTPYNFQPEEYRKPYESSKFSCFPRDEQNPRQNTGLAANHRNEESMRAYSALITGLDANIGKLMRQLKAMGQSENTLVIFTADQGWNAGHHGMWGKGNGTVPRNMYEESIRIPMIWRHPGSIPAGTRCEAMVSSYDFFPTLLGYLGLETAPDKDRVGENFAPFLRGESPAWRDRLFFEYAETRSLRTRTMKLVMRAKPWDSELYDLEVDPGEEQNVVEDAKYASLRASLTKELEGYFAKRGALPIDEWQKSANRTVTFNKSISDK